MSLPDIDFDSTSYADGLELVKSAGLGSLEEIKDALTQYFVDNPGLADSLKNVGIGAAGGAGLGALSSLAQRKGRRTPFSRALTGGLIGGGGAGAMEFLKRMQSDSAKLDQDVDVAALRRIAGGTDDASTAQTPTAPKAPKDMTDAEIAAMPTELSSTDAAIDAVKAPWSDPAGRAAAGALGAGAVVARYSPQGKKMTMGEQYREPKGAFDPNTRLGGSEGADSRKAFADMNKLIPKHFPHIGEQQAGDLIRKHGTHGAFTAASKIPLKGTNTGSWPGSSGAAALGPKAVEAYKTHMTGHPNVPGLDFQRSGSKGLLRPWTRTRKPAGPIQSRMRGPAAFMGSLAAPYILQGVKGLLGYDTAWGQANAGLQDARQNAAQTRLDTKYPQQPQ